MIDLEKLTELVKSIKNNPTVLAGIVNLLVVGVGVYDSASGKNIAGTEVYATIVSILTMLGLYGRISATKEITK